MANKFEMGSSEFTLPEQAKEHYTDEQFEEKREMYDAIEYEEGIDPIEYKAKQETSKKAAKKIIEFQKHINEKVLNKELKAAKMKNIGKKTLSSVFMRAA